mgnify:CR=1 FL=1
MHDGKKGDSAVRADCRQSIKATSQNPLERFWDARFTVMSGKRKKTICGKAKNDYSAFSATIRSRRIA